MVGIATTDQEEEDEYCTPNSLCAKALNDKGVGGGGWGTYHEERRADISLSLFCFYNTALMTTHDIVGVFRDLYCFSLEQVRGPGDDKVVNLRAQDGAAVGEGGE